MCSYRISSQSYMCPYRITSQPYMCPYRISSQPYMCPYRTTSQPYMCPYRTTSQPYMCPYRITSHPAQPLFLWGDIRFPFWPMTPLPHDPTSQPIGLNHVPNVAHDPIVPCSHIMALHVSL